MTERTASPDNSAIAAEACAWIAQFESGELSEKDLDAFREWIKRSPRHAAEMRRYAHLWDDLNLLTEMAQPIAAALKEKNRLAEPDLLGRTQSRRWLTAAAAALMLMIGAGLYFLPNAEQRDGPIFVSTEVGEHRFAELTDGTKIDVNTDSQLEVDFTEEVRKVRLLKGEALFTVAKDPDRPFIVYAGARTVTAVGTAFSVRLSDRESIEIVVSEGVVELASIPAIGGRAGEAGLVNAGPDAIMRAGQKALVKRDSIGAIEFVTPAEIERKLGWTEGILDFSDEPLADVIAELSRYTDLRIVILDPEIERLQFGGVFRIGEIDTLFGALEQSFGIRVVRSGGGLIYLSSMRRGDKPLTVDEGNGAS